MAPRFARMDVQNSFKPAHFTLMPQKIILDCDPGHDDAIAILLACASPELDVLGITTVAGNVPLDKTSYNALRICEAAGLHHIPVFAGMPRPLVRNLYTAEHVHGKSGLEGPTFPEPTRELDPHHAVDFIINQVLCDKDPITLVPTGPLTNIASVLIREPKVAKRVKEIVLMGGAIYEGNSTPSAEFNIYVDPHAAKVVFDSGAQITMIGLDTTHQALAIPERVAKMKALGTPIAEMVIGLIEFFQGHHKLKYGMPGPPLHDPCAVAAVIDRSLLTTKTMAVEIEITSELTMGRTVCDIWGTTKRELKAQVATAIDADRFFEL